MASADVLHMVAMDVRVDGGAARGHLVSVEGALLAVLTETEGGGWFLEAGFGPCSELTTRRPGAFSTLDEAKTWIADRLG